MKLRKFVFKDYDILLIPGALLFGLGLCLYGSLVIEELFKTSIDGFAMNPFARPDLIFLAFHIGAVGAILLLAGALLWKFLKTIWNRTQ